MADGIIDFDGVLDIALKGVRRAFAFGVFGINAAAKQDDIPLQLTSHFLAITGAPLSPEQKADLKSSFSNWIISNALRELIESLAVSLDHFYWTMLLSFGSLKEIPHDQKKLEYKRFHFGGLELKLAKLDQLGLRTAFSAQLVSLSRVRNVMTHWRGIIRDQDCNEPGSLRVSWAKLTIGVKYPDDTIDYLTPSSFPYETRDKGQVFARRTTEERSFPVGALVEITAADLPDICTTFYFAIDDLKINFLQLALKEGVTFAPKDASAK